MVFHDHDGVITFQLLPLAILFLSFLAVSSWYQDDREQDTLRAECDRY
jgi:hypothetical protein